MVLNTSLVALVHLLRLMMVIVRLSVVRARETVLLPSETRRTVLGLMSDLRIVRIVPSPVAEANVLSKPVADAFVLLVASSHPFVHAVASVVVLCTVIALDFAISGVPLRLLDTAAF